MSTPQNNKGKRPLESSPDPVTERPIRFGQPNQFYRGESSTTRVACVTPNTTSQQLSRRHTSQRERRRREMVDRQRSHMSRQPNINRQRAQRARWERMATHQIPEGDTTMQFAHPVTVAPLPIVVTRTTVTVERALETSLLHTVPENQVLERLSILENSTDLTREQPNKRQLGQRARRAREQAQRARLLPVVLDHNQENSNNRQLGQRSRRARERAHQTGTLPIVPELPEAVEEHDVQLPEAVEEPVMQQADGPLENELPTEEYGEEEAIQPNALLPELGRHSLGRMNIECPYCGALHWIDEALKRSTVGNPTFGKCCSSGQVQLPTLRTPPLLLRNLFKNLDPSSRHFRNNARIFNSTLAFTSLGVRVDQSHIPGFGPRPFTIHGQLRHQTGALLPEEGHVPTYAQLYIYDPHTAFEYRAQRNEMLHRDVLRQVQQIISENNVFVRLYKHAHEILTAEDNANRSLPAILHFRPKDNKHRNVYNLPTADEIAIVLPGDGTEISRTRDIVLHLRSNQALQRINECHPAYLPLHYVLFFPYGELGWADGLFRFDPITNRFTNKRLTRLDWFRYKLFDRRTEFSSILRGQRLFQEFVVDAWAATEQNNLFWVRNNQSRLRAELYQTLRTTAAAGMPGSQAGRVVLPSSYTGGPRHMFEIYQNSLAITRYNNHPDVFVTMTANPRWPEIDAALLEGQNAVDRPDLVNRVFEEKRKALMRDITHGRIFGDTVAHVYTIEFQKRGLPHMHALIFLASQYKIRNASDVDRIVCAELPDPLQEPELYRTVSTFMIHGPCGARNTKCVCMEKNHCKKNYPKSFTETTTMDRDGYPKYRRRDVRRFTNSRGMEITNQDVVPYNPFLCKKYHCHINVEVCAGIRCVKYIHKYIYKGHDRTTIVIGDRDEIKEYLNARYVGPSEAIWRLLEFKLHEEDPPVMKLDLHLPGMHQVVFDEREELDSVLDRARTQRSTLTAFFERCAQGGVTCTYQQMPERHRWIVQPKIWTDRKKGYMIGRIRLVPPTAGEIFYLRLLLTVVVAPTSFEDLRTVDNVLHITFQAAAHARGLLENDDEWVKCLEEAAVMRTGHQLRRLFAVIIVMCGPNVPGELWNKFHIDLCDDLAHKLRTCFSIQDPTEAEVQDYGLYLLNEILNEHGKDLVNYPSMPVPIRDWGNVIRTSTTNRLLDEHFQLFREAQRVNIDEQISLLNPDQRVAFDEIYDSVSREGAEIFFLNGGAGTGKTFVYNTLATRCRLDEKIVIAVASSGIAALLLEGGRTSHSTFGIPLQIKENSVSSITKQSIQADLLRRAHVLIWDEVPMQNRYCVEVVDRLLKDLRDDSRPFGGLTVVLGGDFRQILPVIRKGSREETIAVTLQKSELWSSVKVLHLYINMRLRADTDNDFFLRFLQQVGTSPQEIIRLPAELYRCVSIDDLLNRVYPNLNNPHIVDAEYLTRRTILSARNDDVSEINSIALQLFHGELKTYLAADKVHTDQQRQPDAENYGSEYINKLNPSGLPPFELKLKIGCPIILLRNLAPKDGLCNGTRLMVVRCQSRVVEARILTGPKAGNLVFIPRISLFPSSEELPIIMSRRQFPVKLAFSMTINKSQGQSVEIVGIDLRTEVFTHGQLYVAMSRCTNFRSISVLLDDPKTDTTTNIVYPEVLL